LPAKICYKPKSLKDLSIYYKICIFLCCAFLATEAATVDTTLFGNGGAGPYTIGNSFPDSATITVRLKDSMPVPHWTFFPDRNAIFFVKAIDSGIPIHIRFATGFYGIPKMFSLFPKVYLNPRDTALKPDSFAAPAAPSGRDKLTLSGYKSVSASMGTLGQVNLEQGLDVRIGGEIRPGTTVIAHLSDQSSSLDGETRDISDFDLINIEITDPSFHSIIGDQYVAWPFTGILSGEQKIKGISLNLTSKALPFSVGAFGAIAGGKSAIETKDGQDGVQGPYYLTGNGESEQILPVSGTMKVQLNGRELEEGTDKDYIVDYELATVTFTPKNAIRNEDIIRFEYEYKSFDYERLIAGGTAGIATPDSTVSVQGVIWSEADNRNQTIDLTLTNAEIAALAAAGNTPPLATTARPVNPNDVAPQSQIYPLYKRQLVGADSVWVYTPYDPVNHPDSIYNYFYVYFQPVSAGGKGAYSIISTDTRGPEYGYIGQDSGGGYTDLAPLPAPQSTTSAEIKAKVNLPLFKATIDMAGQDVDKNLFSPLSEQNDLSAATAISFLLGKKNIDEPSLWLAGDHQFTSSQFSGQPLSLYDCKTQWDDTSIAESPQNRQEWDATTGATIIPGLATSIGYGQSRVDSVLLTDKVSPAVQYRLDNLFSVNYNGSFFRHLSGQDRGFGRQEDAAATLSFPHQTFGLTYRDQYRWDSLGAGSGFFEGGIAYGLLPWNLQEKVLGLSKRKSLDGETATSDTGYEVRWEQSINHVLLPGWRISGTSNYDQSVDYGEAATTTMLVDLTSDVTPPGSGFTSRQHYVSNAEMASSTVQVPIFAGKGMGAYIYDTATQQYVPHVPGDYFMQQQQVYNQSSDERVRNTTADVTWAYKPRRRVNGILGDLSWEGTLASQEQVDADRNDIPSYLPGLLSLDSWFGSPDAGQEVLTADCSYRQEIAWSPRNDSLHQITARLTLTPDYRKVLGYEEGSLETRIEAQRVFKRFTLGAAVDLLSVTHDDTTSDGNDYTLYDRRLEVTQKYLLTRQTNFTLLEVLGLAHQSDSAAPGSTSFDSIFYYQLSPSLTFQPSPKSTVGAMYTWSVTPFSGDADYRMARGFPGGIAHQLIITADVKMGQRFLINGSYRGDIHKAPGETLFEPANNVFSLEVRVVM